MDSFPDEACKTMNDMKAVRLAVMLGLDPRDPTVYATCVALSENIRRAQDAETIVPGISMPPATHKTTSEIPRGAY